MGSSASILPSGRQSAQHDADSTKGQHEKTNAAQRSSQVNRQGSTGASVRLSGNGTSSWQLALDDARLCQKLKTHLLENYGRLEARAQFTGNDHDAFGHMTRDKFAQMLDEFDFSYDESMRLFDMADGNNDGYVDYHEFFQTFYRSELTRQETVAANQQSLVQVVVIIRHGARFPLKPFPMDNNFPRSEEFWKNFKGRLTSIGHMQHIVLGQNLHRHYVGQSSLLNPDFPELPSWIHAYTSASERALASAQSFLLGFLPMCAQAFRLENEDYTVHEKDLGVSVHIANLEEEYGSLLHGFKQNPVYEAKKEYCFSNSPQFQKFAEDPVYVALLDQLWRTTGFPKLNPKKSNYDRLQCLQTMAQEVAIERSHRMEVFNNAEGEALRLEDYRNIRRVADYICRLRYQGLNDNDQWEMSRGAAGTLPATLLAHMETMVGMQASVGLSAAAEAAVHGPATTNGSAQDPQSHGNGSMPIVAERLPSDQSTETKHSAAMHKEAEENADANAADQADAKEEIGSDNADPEGEKNSTLLRGSRSLTSTAPNSSRHTLDPIAQPPVLATDVSASSGPPTANHVSLTRPSSAPGLEDEHGAPERPSFRGGNISTRRSALSREQSLRATMRQGLESSHSQDNLRAAENATPQHKFVLYSAHDNTIMAMLAHLGLRDWPIPEFASFLAFELHADVASKSKASVTSRRLGPAGMGLFTDDDISKGYFVKIAYNPDPSPARSLNSKEEKDVLSDFYLKNLPIGRRDAMSFEEAMGEGPGQWQLDEFERFLRSDRQCFSNEREWQEAMGVDPNPNGHQSDGEEKKKKKKKKKDKDKDKDKDKEETKL